MSKLPILKSERLIKILLKMRFVKHHQVGSHVQFKHADGRRVTVAVHKGKEIPKGTLRAIINDLGMTVEQLISQI